MTDWIQINGNLVHKSQLMILNNIQILERNRNKLIKEIKNKNTNISQLKKTVNQFEKVQKEMK